MLFSDCFTGFCRTWRFTDEPYHILCYPARDSPTRLVPMHQQDIFKLKWKEMLVVGVLKLVNHTIPGVRSFAIVEKKGSKGNLS